MNTIFAIVVAGDEAVAGVLAGEALRRAAAARDVPIDVEVRAGSGIISPLDPRSGDARDVILLVADGDVEDARFAGIPRERASISDVLHDPRAVVDRVARALARDSGGAPAVAVAGGSGARIVAVTSCPTGIAHTFMAAEGLERAGSDLGLAVRVETQGSVGAGNALTAAEIAAADVVIIAADREVDRARFAGKRVFASGTKPAIADGKALVRRALDEATVQADRGDASGSAGAAGGRAGAYKHLMNGVSFMLPFVVSGGLLIALAFAFGGIYASKSDGTFANALFLIGAKAAFTLFVPILAGYIAFSIADRPGLAPGMIGGVLAVNAGAGFIGGIAAGFIAGYGVDALNKAIRLPKNLAGLKPVLVLPVLGSLLTGLVMIYVVGGPVAHVLAFMTAYLRGMQGSSAIVLGALLGAMMAFDLGGPVNKAAYAFSTGLLTSDVFGPMAATMAAGMVPPLAIALATKVFPNRFTPDEREAGNAAAVLGLAFISEGAIPFAARDPFRVIPSLMAGSALAGAISMSVGAQLRVPHGGVFVLPIPGAVTNLGSYVVALLAGTIASATILGIVKRPLVAAPVAKGVPATAATVAATAIALVAALALGAGPVDAATPPSPVLAAPAPAVGTPSPAPAATASPQVSPSPLVTGAPAIVPQFNYTGEAATNPVGGLRSGSAYAGQVFVGADVDMGALAGVRGGIVHLGVTNRHGDNLAATSLGSGTSVQEIYGTQNTHLARLTWEQAFAHGRIDVEAGRIPANISFLSSPYYCNFQSNSACGNPTFVFKTSNFTYWPASSWGAHVRAALGERTYVHVGAYEVNPDRKRPTDDGFRFDTDRATGVVVPFEFGYSTTFENDRYPQNYRLGGWYDGGAYVDPTTGATARGRSGAFFRFDRQLTRPELGTHRGLGVFGVVMGGLAGHLIEDRYEEIGLVQTGTFRGRNADTLGVVVNEQHFTDAFLDPLRAARRTVGASTNVPASEVMMEFAYGAQLTPAVRVSPNVQYVLAPDQASVPGRSTPIPNALVFGLKFTLDVPTLLRSRGQ
ncbi:MAG: hypothetical protein NVSMB59_04640 [Vulcanimicrobiaceae bacterium]